MTQSEIETRQKGITIVGNIPTEVVKKVKYAGMWVIMVTRLCKADINIPNTDEIALTILCNKPIIISSQSMP